MNAAFSESANYPEKRYRKNGNPAAGSYMILGSYKQGSDNRCKAIPGFIY